MAASMRGDISLPKKKGYRLSVESERHNSISPPTRRKYRKIRKRIQSESLRSLPRAAEAIEREFVLFMQPNRMFQQAICL